MAYAMVSMELDDEDKLDAAMPMPMPSKPDYPYGLRICLTEKEMAKLKLEAAEAFIGGIVHFHCLGRITDTHLSENGGGQTCRIEIQIEDMSIESEDEENDKD